MEKRIVIKNFFSRFFDTSSLADSDDIFAAGYVNSLFAMQLIAWIEKEFKIAIEDEDLQLKNFNSIDAISGFVNQKLTAPA